MDSSRTCPSCHQPLAPDAPHGLCPACLLRAGFATEAGPDAATNRGATTAAARAPFVPPTVEELAKFFPQLEIVALLGQGGMGAVYKARQPALDRWVALKILPPEATARPGFSERFNREARALARLNHPGIVAVYDFGEAGGMPYFVMELVDGVNLRQLARQSRMDARAALQIVPAICDALQYAHDEGVVHRDIKPENILIDRKGRVKIADFGIARIVDESASASASGEQITDSHQVVGTPHYMAPEQLERPQSVDHRADIFALGVVFYELLTGELPLGKFPPPSKRVQIDVRLDEIVLRALEKDPALRYQHASEVRTQIETMTSGAAPLAAATSLTSKMWLLLAVGSAAGSAIVLLLLVALMWTGLGASELVLIASPLLVIAIGVSVLIVSKAKGARSSRGVGLALSMFGLLVAITTLTISLFTRGSRSTRSSAPVAIENPSITTPSAWPEFDRMESDPESLSLLIAEAESALAIERARHDAGVSDPAEMAAAQEKLELLEARRDGDRVAYIAITAKFAKQRLATATAQFQAGLITEQQLRFAQVQAELARRRHARAMSKVPAGSPLAAPLPAAVQPATASLPAEWTEFDRMENDPDSLRLLIGEAESALAIERARYDTGVGEPGAVAMAQENLELLKARLDGDRVAFFAIKAKFAKLRLEIVAVKFKTGLITEQELKRAQVEEELARRRHVRAMGMVPAGSTPTVPPQNP